MKNHFAPLGAILSVLALLAWISSSARDDQSAIEVEEPLAASVRAPSNDEPVLREQTGGSAVPCAVPLGWRIARVDESFELSHAEARAALDQAATLWEDAVGPGLFSNESDGALSIRFVYDDRQARTQEQNRLVTDFDEVSVSLEAERVEFEGRRQRYDAMRRQYQDAHLDFDRRVTTLNDSIRYWNARGGAPGGVLSELGTSERVLDVEREALAVRGREIEGLQQRLVDDSERLDREMEAHRREGEALQTAFPVSRFQAGIYREAVHSQEGKVTSVPREIRIYRFNDLDNLVGVAAHELGHALGLGHSTVPGSVMREEFVLTDLSQDASGVQPADVEALRSLCSEL